MRPNADIERIVENELLVELAMGTTDVAVSVNGKAERDRVEALAAASPTPFAQQARSMPTKGTRVGGGTMSSPNEGAAPGDALLSY